MSAASILWDDYRATPTASRGGVALLGNFDGVHRGHQALIAEGRARADALDAPLVALTFEPHPRAYFVKDTGPFRLTSAAAKARLLGEYGVDAVLAQRFDAGFAELPAEAFVDDVLVAGLGVRHVVAGYDFTFGRRRGGNADMLESAAPAKGFGATVVDPVTLDGEIFSSTRIREALRGGQAKKAAELLGRPWEIEGVVEQGDRRGRTIGFPTANVALGDYLRPQFGVYAIRAGVQEPGGWAWRAGVANLGKRPTFGKIVETFEVHVFDFAGDLYGETLRVQLVDFVRPERKFESFDALKAQIAEDAVTARRLLA